MAIVEYKIVRAPSASALAAEVSAALADGWQPHGAIVRDELGGALLQALTKEEVIEEEEGGGDV